MMVMVISPLGLRLEKASLEQSPDEVRFSEGDGITGVCRYKYSFKLLEISLGPLPSSGELLGECF